jgi:hypothetical protein
MPSLSAAASSPRRYSTALNCTWLITGGIDADRVTLSSSAAL